MNIIAECGCNWTSIEEAKEMIRRSQEIGCWASKFQLFTKNEVPHLPNYLYLTFDETEDLFNYGESINQRVFFTPMYLEVVDFLECLGVEYYKIRQKDSWNIPLIKKVVRTSKPFFVSLTQFDFYYEINTDLNIRPLLCVPKYPACFEDYLNIITFGYSDHTPDFRLFKYARDHQALWFEKHVKLEGTKPLENDWSVSFEELEKAF